MKFSGDPLQGRRRHQVLRPPGDQGHPGLLRVLANPDDEVSARRIVNVPKRGIGDTSVARLAAWAQVRARPASARPSTAPRRPGSRGKALQGGRAALPRRWPSCGRWCRRSTRPTSCSWWPTAPGTWPSWWPSTRHEADGRIENLAELAAQAAEFDDVIELPRDGGPGGRLRRARQRRHPGLADDPAHGQGARVPGRLPRRPGGGDLPALPLPGRAERARGGAPALLRGHHPGPPASGDLARLVPHDLGTHPAGDAEPLRHRGARRIWSRTSGSARPADGSGYDSLSGDEHLPGAVFAPAVPLAAASRAATPAAPAWRPGGSRAAPGPRTSGWSPATRWCTTTGARASCISAKGEGSRAQATVDFDSVGKKNLLLSATPLRRA